MSNLVECYSGVEYAERPRALIWEGQRLEIVDIIESSLVPEGKRFRVGTTDDGAFELIYNQAEDNWQIRPI